MLSPQPAEDGGEQAGNECLVASDANFANSRVGEEFDVPDALAQVVEDSDSAIKQRATVNGRLDALRAAIEENDPERALQICNGPGYCGLGDVKLVGRFSHAARLDDSHQDIEFPKFQPASDPRVPVQGGYAL